MANLETTNVFIDTEAFDASNLNFQPTVFKELVRLVQAGRVKVFLTTVTESEILAHITQGVHEAFIALERFRNDGRLLKNVKALAAVFADFDEEEAIAEITKNFERFLADADVEIINVDDTDAEAVFKNYFD